MLCAMRVPMGRRLAARVPQAGLVPTVTLVSLEGWSIGGHSRHDTLSCLSEISTGDVWEPEFLRALFLPINDLLFAMSIRQTHELIVR